MSRPIKLLYYFTVEGPSEKRYLEYLQKIINQELTDVSEATKWKRPSGFTGIPYLTGVTIPLLNKIVSAHLLI